MNFFVDTNVLVYCAVQSDYRVPCLEIVEAIARRGAPGVTSTAVLEEVWYVELTGRAGPLEGLTRQMYQIFTPLLAVTDEAFRMALSVNVPAVGANDRLHVGTCIANGIPTIVSADQGFDRVRDVRRVDPLDAQARRALLSGSI